MSHHLPRDPEAEASLTAAAARHGIELTPEQARLAAESRPSMVSAVAAVGELDVTGNEPAAVFPPVTASRGADSGNGEGGCADG